MRVVKVLLSPAMTVVSKGRLLIIDIDLERALDCAERLHAQGIICIHSDRTSVLSNWTNVGLF